MLTKEEREAIIGLIEDEMQMDDWICFSEETREALISAYEKLKGMR